MGRLRLIRAFLCIVGCLLPAVPATAQTHPADAAPLPFGTDAYQIPPSTTINATPPRTVELLAEALAAKPVASRRIELLRDLGLAKLPGALPHIIPAMSDPDPAVRAEAARAAAMLGDRAASPALHKLLSDSDSAVRIEAVRAGASLGDPAFVMSGLKDPDESVFTAACALASAREHDQQIAARLGALSPAARAAAVRALGRRGDSADASLVADQLSSPDVKLVIAAIDSLAQMKSTSHVEAVSRLLAHAHPTVRRAAVAATAALAGADEQIAVARRMLADADPSVRQHAALLLAAHPSSDAIQTLVEQLSAGYGPLHLAARQALVASAAVPMQPAVDAAVKLLDDPDPRRREDGSYILGQIRSDLALDRHIKLLSDSDWDLVRQAAESLGEIGNPQAGPELARIASGIGAGDDISGLGSAQTRAIVSAFVACGQVGHQPALALARPLIPKKMTCPPSIRSATIWACGVLGEANDAALAGTLLSVYNDNTPYEFEEVRFEAMKAIGNLRYTAALETVRRQGQEHPMPRLRWMAHLVADRLAGTQTPYVPPSGAVIAETSIQQLGE